MANNFPPYRDPSGFPGPPPGPGPHRDPSGYAGPPPGMPYEAPDNITSPVLAQVPQKEEIDLETTIPRIEMYLKKECPIPVTNRDGWGAVPPTSVEEHVLPLTHLRFTHTATELCYGDECHQLLRDLQKKHMDEGLSDIKWNFMVAADGMVYEGRGWNAQAVRPDYEYGWNLLRHKGKSCDIAFIGTFDDKMEHEVPWKTLTAAFHFTSWASNWKLLAECFTITQLRPPPSGDML